MDIRWRMRSRPNARRAVVALVGGIAEETFKSDKSASFMRRRLLSIDLLKADDVGCKFSHDGPENGHTMCELCFMPSRPSKIFQIERRDAKRDGHYKIILAQRAPNAQCYWSCFEPDPLSIAETTLPEVTCGFHAYDDRMG